MGQLQLVTSRCQPVSKAAGSSSAVRNSLMSLPGSCARLGDLTDFFER